MDYEIVANQPPLEWNPDQQELALLLARGAIRDDRKQETVETIARMCAWDRSADSVSIVFGNLAVAAENEQDPQLQGFIQSKAMLVGLMALKRHGGQVSESKLIL